MVSLVVVIWPGVSRKRRWMTSGVMAGVAGQPGAERSGQGLGQDGEHDVEVDVEVDRAGQRVGAARIISASRCSMVIRRACWRMRLRVVVSRSLVMITVGVSWPRPVTISWRTVPG